MFASSLSIETTPFVALRWSTLIPPLISPSRSLEHVLVPFEWDSSLSSNRIRSHKFLLGSQHTKRRQFVRLLLSSPPDKQPVDLSPQINAVKKSDRRRTHKGRAAAHHHKRQKSDI
ncbi:hypothetical protein PROFUN_09699 [Planoprotostelium fungivorum]|uniref:Uncharacterized protein n=1 Tax=Planoprotostelium fungivorum TaxID=1890364 RepID=A0A2P6NEU7_9EUKA|nr:hypothetical protein PROFUN_09699 [Planoprotostelium fungivorum]